MGLATRVIPTLLFRGDSLVKGERFNSWRSVGHVVQAAKIYAHRAVDEIVLLDIGATPENRGPNCALVEKIAKDFFTPLTVGGGVRNVQDVRDLLNAGADKVAVCTEAWPLFGPLVTECAGKFGSQAIVASIDYRGRTCYLDCGRVPASSTPSELATEYAKLGAGEILLTSIDLEGTMSGYDIATIREVSAAVGVPVIAHGGCSGYEDMAAALAAGASAVAAGALFQFTDRTPKGAARFLAEHGFEARV